MKKHPLQVSRRAVRTVRDSDAEVESPVGAGWTGFRYSYIEVSATGAGARIKSKRAAYENGRLVSESFEGDLERGDYERMIGEAQRRFAEQASGFLRALFPFAALARKPRSEWD